MVVFEKGTYYRDLLLNSFFSCLRTQQIKEAYIFVCPFVKFLVWMKWLKSKPSFCNLGQPMIWEGDLPLYHNKKPYQSTSVNSKKYGGKWICKDGIWLSQTLKHLLQKSPSFKPLETAHFSDAITTSKTQKPMGVRFSKKTSAQIPYNEASHHRVNISRLETGFHPFFVISTAVFLNPSQKHMSLSWLRSAFSHPQQDQLCVKDMLQGCRIFVKENSHFKYLQTITRPFKKAIHDVF